jgi:GT2 family glycosyltransferase
MTLFNRSALRVRKFFRKAGVLLRDLAFLRSYERWLARYDTLTQTDRQQLRHDISALPRTPIISVIMPVSGADWQSLQVTISSMRRQLYPYWELCLCADASVPEERCADLQELARHDARIRSVLRKDATTWARKGNGALLLASGNFVASIDPGDVLAEHALYWVAKEVLAYSDTQLIFSDEDKIGSDGTRFDPWFKSDWNPALMISCNAFGRLGVYDRTLVEKLGGFRVGFDGGEEYDLALRCARVTDSELIRHIPRVLYHRRSVKAATPEYAKPEGLETGRRAVMEHLAGLGISARVELSQGTGYRIRYEIPSSRPLVSVLIPTTARPALLGPCIESLLGRTGYDNFEVLILVSEAELRFSDRADLLKRVAQRPRVQLLAYPNRPFNYSWVSNWGAAQISGDVLCFLNDDTEVIRGDWLEHLVARVLLPGVAAAGPMLYYPNDTIQHAGVILGLGGVAGHACDQQPRGGCGYFGRACLEQDVSCVTAACMVIRSDVFKALHGFDEAMPIAYNDVDLCIRLRQRGWRIIWTPIAELYHHESASLGRHDSGERAEQFLRDVALMRQRWGSILDADPFYNRNLSLDRSYKLAFPPR